MSGVWLWLALASTPVVQAADKVAVTEVSPYWRPVELHWGGLFSSRLIADGVAVTGDNRTLVAWQQSLLEPVGGLPPAWGISQTKRWIGWALIGASAVVAVLTFGTVGLWPAAIVLGVGLVTVSMPPYASQTTERYEAWRQSDVGWQASIKLAQAAETARWRALGLDPALEQVCGLGALLAEPVRYPQAFGGKARDRIHLLEESEAVTELTPTLAWVLATDPSADVRHTAWRVVRARAAEQVVDEATSRGLVTWVSVHGDEPARLEAVTWLGRHSDATAFLHPALQHPDEETRIAAAKALVVQAKRIGPEGARAVLEERLGTTLGEDERRVYQKQLRRLD